MTTENRLAKSETRKPEKSAQDWVDEGNARLAGLIPYTSKKYEGQFHVRTDVRWVLRDGRCVIDLVG